MQLAKINRFFVLFIIWLLILQCINLCFGMTIDLETMNFIRRLQSNPEKINTLTKNESIMFGKIKSMILDRINQERALNFWTLRQG